MVSLVRHVVREQTGPAPAEVAGRLPLLLRCCRRRPPLVAAAVAHLQEARCGGGPRAAAAGRLLVELYLQLPHVIALLDGGGELLQTAPLGQSGCHLHSGHTGCVCLPWFVVSVPLLQRSPVTGRLLWWRLCVVCGVLRGSQ